MQLIWQAGARIFNGGYWNNAVAGNYADLKRHEHLDAEGLKALQYRKLRRLLFHTYAHSPFYRQRFDKLGLHPEDFTSLKQLRQIPPVSREDLNDHLEELRAANLGKQEIHYASTGGSTGLATRFIRDNRCLAVKKASELRFNSWTGWQPGERILYYWPALKDFSGTGKGSSLWQAKSLKRELQLYAGILNTPIMAEHLQLFRSFKPDLVRAFPNSLEIFARYLMENHLTLPVRRGVICVGEPLNDLQRQLFSKVFACEVYNCYVSRECGNIACECSEHGGLHVADDLLLVEIDAPEGEIGEILITDLENFGMPFIRYRIQDGSKWMRGECECGRGLSRLDLNAARLTDFLVSPIDGSRISGATLVHYLLAEGPPMNRFQLIQDGADHITVNYAGGLEDSEKEIAHIRSTISRIFKGGVEMDVHYVPDIPFLKSGKYRFVERTFS